MLNASGTLLESIKNENRRNLGKRFNIWIDAQWGYEKGSFDKWRVSEERAIRDITESILLDTTKYFAESTTYYFTYKDNKLISDIDYIPSLNPVLSIDVLVFKELLRDYRLEQLGIE